jgi:hypothetical protein
MPELPSTRALPDYALIPRSSLGAALTKDGTTSATGERNFSLDDL